MLTTDELLTLRTLLNKIHREHPEYEIVLTEAKGVAKAMYEKSHEDGGAFSISLACQVQMCLDDRLNTNL